MPAMTSTSPAMLASTLKSANGEADRITIAPQTENTIRMPE